MVKAIHFNLKLQPSRSVVKKWVKVQVISFAMLSATIQNSFGENSELEYILAFPVLIMNASTDQIWLKFIISLLLCTRVGLIIL